MSTPTITASQVKELRDQTGAGMMDCKAALTETGGDIDAAVELLRVRLGDKALKMGGREATEGTVQAYIHTNGKTGVLVEVDCNTDFVARNDDFIAFARDVALHVAASPQVQYVSEDEIPEDAKQAELRVFEQQAADKPENVRGKIAEGKLRKWMEEVVLLNQEHVNGDKHDGKTIEQIRAELSGHHGRERRDPALLEVRGRGVSTARLRADPAEAVGRGADGRPPLRHRPRARAGDRAPDQRGPRPRRRDRDRASAPATSTAAWPAPPRAWSAPPATTWACSPPCSTR